MMVCACSDNESKQATPDTNVTIDGALDEDFWGEQKWLTSTYFDGSGNKTIQSTASFGKNGLYFGVTLEDEAVYNDDDGVLQVYFASEEYSSVADGLYRFSFAAGGTAALTKYTESGNFESVTPDDESMPQTAMQRNGAVYNAEIFLPYALFGNTIDSVWFNAAVPVSGSDEWYNFAENEIGGDPLTVNTWWPMNASGLHAYDISIEAGEGGQISTTRDYLLPGEKVVFTFNVEDGHYIKALTLNGIDVLGDIREDGGVITYTSPAMNKGIVLKAEFGQTFTVSGTIHYDGAVSEDMNADLSLSLSNDDAAVTVAFDGTNGTFTAEVPAGEYTLTLTSVAEGYVIWSETITVEADKKVDINVGKEVCLLLPRRDRAALYRLGRHGSGESARGGNGRFLYGRRNRNKRGGRGMSNFEMKYTIRLYDPELVVEIGKLYKAHSKEFRNKNEFMTCLIRLGVDALNATPPTAPAAAAVPPAMALDKLYEEMRKIESITDETGKFLKVQGQKMDTHIAVMEKLLASLYNMNLGELSGSPPLPRKVEDGFFDDLPVRFAKIILTLEQKFGNK